MPYRQYSLSGETVDHLVAVLHAAEAFNAADDDRAMKQSGEQLLAAIEQLPDSMRDWTPDESDREIYSLTGDDVAATYDAFHADDDSDTQDHLGSPREDSAFWKLTPERREELLEGAARDLDIEWVDALESRVEDVVSIWQVEDLGK